MCLMTSGRNHSDPDGGVVSLNFTSWNQMVAWLRAVNSLEHAA
jgi:hypothetical protein